MSCLTFFPYSLSIERLSIHIKLKEKIATRRNRKFKAAHRQYLKSTFEGGHKGKNLTLLLNKRRDALFEICVRFYEEERKKAEGEITEVIHSYYYLFKILMICDFFCRKRQC